MHRTVRLGSIGKILTFPTDRTIADSDPRSTATAMILIHVFFLESVQHMCSHIPRSMRVVLSSCGQTPSRHTTSREQAETEQRRATKIARRRESPGVLKSKEPVKRTCATCIQRKCRRRHHVWGLCQRCATVGHLHGCSSFCPSRFRSHE